MICNSFVGTRQHPTKGSDDIACNYNEDYNLVDFFSEGGPELNDLGESWTDYYDNLESADLFESGTEPITMDGFGSDQSEPPEEDDENNFFEVEDGPGDEEEQENDPDFRRVLNGTEVPEYGSK